MSAEATRRLYVFRGRIVTLLVKDTSLLSRHDERYAVQGKLWFQGRRAGGGTIEVDIDEEPENANFLYPSAEEAGEGSSEAEEEDEPGARQEPVEQSVQRRRLCVLVLHDTGQLVLPHVGMWFSALLIRGGLLSAAEGGTSAKTYRDHEYVVQRVMNWFAARSVSLHDIWLEVADLKRADQQAYQASMNLERAGVRERSQTASAGKMSGKPKLNNKNVNDILKRVGRRQLTSLWALCSLETSTCKLGAPVMSALGNYYALAQTALVATVGQQTNLAEMLSKLRVSARVACQTSMCELVVLYNMYCEHEKSAPHLLLFFGARDVLPQHGALAGTVVDTWQGMIWSPFKGGVRLGNAMRACVETELADAVLENIDDPVDVFVLAYELHREQQRWLATDNNDMFDAGKLLAAVIKNRRWHHRRRREDDDSSSEEDPVTATLFDAALRFMFRVGAWRRVPESTAQRLLMMQHWKREHNASLWLTTERQYGWLSRVVTFLRGAQPVLARQDYTGAPIALRAHTLYLYCATPIILPPSQKVPPLGAAAAALYTMLDRARYDDNDERFVLEVAAFQRVILYDAHMLDRARLVPTLALLARAKALVGDQLQVEIHGDDTLHSWFADVYKANCFSHASGELTRSTDFAPTPMHDEFDDVFVQPQRKREQYDVLRDACRMAPQNAANQQAFIAELMKTAGSGINNQSARAAEMLAGQTDAWRWLVLADTHKEAVASVYAPLRVSVALRANENWARELARFLGLLCDSEHERTDLVSYMSPYVAYYNQCVRIETLYVLRKPARMDAVLDEQSCQRLHIEERSSLIQVASLDSAQLYMALDVASMAGIDHRICCRTWASNVLHVARHRAELCSQSFTMARHAMPHKPLRQSARRPPHTTGLLFANSYRFDDVYVALARAACSSARETFVSFNLSEPELKAALEKRYGTPRTYLTDMLNQ